MKTPHVPPPTPPHAGLDALETFEREAWTLTFRAAGIGPPTSVRVRKLLKMALRTCGLRCVDMRSDSPTDSVTSPE